MKSLIVIRHARSEHNIHKTNSLDSSITDFGITQAKVVGEYLSRQDFSNHTFYVSPFLRCLMTMDNIIQKLDIKQKPAVTALLGEYLKEGQSIEVPVREEQFPNFDWSNYQKPTIFTSEDSHIENIKTIHSRLDDKSFVVSHGIPCLLLILTEEGRLPVKVPKWDYSIANCSITLMENGERIWNARDLHFEYSGCRQK